MPDVPGQRHRAFLQLLRPANVATALADVLAGFAVSGRPLDVSLIALLASGASLYAGGIVLNDVFDRHLDARERPERPLPSGKISPITAGILGAILLVLGVALAALSGPVSALVALATATAVVLYNGWSKHNSVLGPINMGLCRALNLLVGVSAVPAALATHWPLGAIPLAYIAGVTIVSRGEVHGGRHTTAVTAWVLVSSSLAALAVLALRTQPVSALVAALLVSAVAAWRILPAFWRAVKQPAADTARAAVRTGVLSLVLVDAAIATTYADIIWGAAVLATGVVAVRLARVFAVT